MRKYAILENNSVIEIQNLSEEDCLDRMKLNGVIDIEDLIPEPSVGWVLDGNKLVDGQSNPSADELDTIQQIAQRRFGERLLKSAVDRLGARNLKLAREQTPADVAGLANNMASIKLLLEGGALKTVRAICNAVKNNFPQHVDILQFVIDEITNFLTENGWN